MDAHKVGVWRGPYPGRCGDRGLRVVDGRTVDPWTHGHHRPRRIEAACAQPNGAGARLQPGHENGRVLEPPPLAPCHHVCVAFRFARVLIARCLACSRGRALVPGQADSDGPRHPQLQRGCSESGEVRGRGKSAHAKR